MIDSTERISVGRYLATRLVQLGARHGFGLPGDFNLNLLDEMTLVDEWEWVGSANELNAAYTADGYARAGRRLGAFVTTFGVGELSAVNGLAGSFAEDVPVLHISGMPARASMQARLPLHHTLLDGDFDRFVRISREVTVADAVLRAEDAGDEIDRVLIAMLTSSKPGYLGIPLDVARLTVSAAPLARPLRPEPSDSRSLDAFTRALDARLGDARSLVVLAGPRLHRLALEESVAALAGLPGVRIASQTGSKAILDEDHPASLGIYIGAATRLEQSRAAVDAADPLVLVGAMFSDFTTGFFTHRFDPAEAIELALDHTRIGPAMYPRVRLEDALAALREVLARGEASATPTAVVSDAVPPRARADELNHASFWPEIQSWLQPDSTIAAEAGTAFYGALDLDLPARSDLLGQPVWSSIGFTLPATFGAMLARPDRRPILFIGDGSAQLTVQELGHLYAYGEGRGPVVFLLDNSGYTVERRIQSPDAAYQDIIRWDWDLIPAAFGARDVAVLSATTLRELREALSTVRDRDRAAFVRVVLPRLDAPRLLETLVAGISEANDR